MGKLSYSNDNENFLVNIEFSDNKEIAKYSYELVVPIKYLHQLMQKFTFILAQEFTFSIVPNHF